MNSFDLWWNFLKLWEKEYVNNPADPGGLTIFGLSMKSNPKIVKELDTLYKSNKEKAEEKAKEYTKQFYWKPMNCDYIEIKLAIVKADTCFLQGPTIAGKVVKEAILDYTQYLRNLIPENQIWIIALIKRYDFIDDIKPTLYEKFGRGWSKRITSLYDYLVSDFKVLKYD